MVLVGLTGSIGAGKSTVTDWLREQGLAVFDADACVHTLYENEAVTLVEHNFPGSTENGKVNRAALLKILAGKEDGFNILENIIHPLVNQKKREFLQHCQSHNTKLCFFDIPLLFETNQENMFDLTVVLSVTPQIQQQRVLSRLNMTQEKLDLVLKRQMPNPKKIELAGYVINNNGTIKQLETELEMLLFQLKKMSGKAFNNWNL